MAGQDWSVEKPDQRIVVVVADPAVRLRVVRALREQGYITEIANSAPDVVTIIERTPPDLVVLDIALPTISVGWGVLGRLRELGVPTIVYANQAEEPDRIVGLELGADDYLPKSSSPRELVARVRAVLRRVTRSAQVHRLNYDKLVIDLRGRKVFVEGREVPLRPKEFDLLAFLASSPGQVFSRAQLLEHVWRSLGEWQSPDTVTEHMRRIRLAIENDPAQPRWLVTVRGIGYRFEQ